MAHLSLTPNRISIYFLRSRLRLKHYKKYIYHYFFIWLNHSWTKQSCNLCFKLLRKMRSSPHPNIHTCPKPERHESSFTRDTHVIFPFSCLPSNIRYAFLEYMFSGCFKSLNQYLTHLSMEEICREKRPRSPYTAAFGVPAEAFKHMHLFNLRVKLKSPDFRPI